MSALSTDQKNTNILNRFEPKEGGSHSKAFSVELIDGAKMTVIDLNYKNFQEVTKSVKNKFGERVKSVKEICV